MPGVNPGHATGLIMRYSGMWTAVTVLLGGCATFVPPQRTAPPEPAPPVVEPLVEAAAPQEEAPRAAPGPPTPVRIDNTSLEAFRASWQRLSASLSPAQRTDLNNAVMQLTFARYGGTTNMPGNLRGSPIVPEMIRDRIDGLTYAEIVALPR